MKVLFAASEIFPYAKTGGLADVANSLPCALKKYSDISRVMPLYGFMFVDTFLLYDNFTVSLDGGHYGVEIYTKEDEGIVTYFIKAAHLSQTQQPYGDEKGDYADNALRFGIFCMAIVELSIRLNIELIHLNDWHTALVAFFVKEHDLDIKTIFTIHNLAYQGIFTKDVLALLGINNKYFHMDALEFYGKINFLKAGVAFSDAITTVSPTYAKEIQTPAFGCGLDGFLKLHEKKLSGILNGINLDVFPPLKNIEQKKKAKKILCKKYGFKNPDLPLFVMVSRLVEQKGIDLVLHSFEDLRLKEINIFIVGEGDKRYAEALTVLSKKYENFYFFQGYDEALSHQTYLASDFLLMPSSFEPCGLNQFIAMQNASIAVVHEVGGLKDSVHEEKAVCGQGITYTQQNQKEFLYAVDRALELQNDTKKRQRIVAFNLGCDFSFDRGAKAYLKIYNKLCEVKNV
jgi:starch synthase